MGTEIFKIEEEMTEKMKPKVANTPLKKTAKYWSFLQIKTGVKICFANELYYKSW